MAKRGGTGSSAWPEWTLWASPVGTGGDQPGLRAGNFSEAVWDESGQPAVLMARAVGMAWDWPWGGSQWEARRAGTGGGRGRGTCGPQAI